MGRLTRAEMQERNRAKVLAAARDEFTERGFRDAKIDSIAERAELTRGAVYSNFPGKRALYFSVLAEDAERVPGLSDSELSEPGDTAGTALAAFARAWLARLPLSTDAQPGLARLGVDLMPEVIADERTRIPFAELTRLNAILLGLALERLRAQPRSAAPLAGETPAPLAGETPAPLAGETPAPLAGETPARLVGVAEVALTTLHGASQLAAAAPGFVEPFHVISACAQLANLDLGDRWQPAHLPHISPARPVDEPWSPPSATDAVRGEPVPLAGDGVVAILGLHRLSAIEEAVRAVPAGLDVTAVLVSSVPEELAPLARLAVADFRTCLRQAFPPSVWPRLRVVHDETGRLAAAAGVAAVSDVTETAVRVEAGRIVARADGYGACHAAASVGGRPSGQPVQV
ncbi:TetR family transcriptional regulator [Micromonospora sp. NPDC003197]